MTQVITTSGASLLEVVQRGVRIYDLGRPYERGMPQSPNHPVYTHSLLRRHGDAVRSDGGSAANDLIVLGTHVGTHIDALAHVSQAGALHGGLDAASEQVGGRFMTGGIQDVAPMVCRGVLLDIPAALGQGACAPAYQVTVADLETAVERQGTAVGAGDVVLIRTGWGQRWGDHAAYVGAASGVPGISSAGARWVAERGVRAVGADTIAFEHLPAGAGHSLLPAHRILLVESGINIIETLSLEELAATQVREFVFVLSPLNLTGATGSPVRPLAVVSQ